jgi:serine protease Do
MKKINSLILALLVSLVILKNNAFAKPLWIEGDETNRQQVEVNIPSFAPMIEKWGPAVVSISIEGKETAKGNPLFQRPGPNGQPSPFDFFFQNPQEGQSRRIQSLGSGFVIHPDGYIVTNNHVIEKASEITVTFKDEKKTYSAKVIGSDKKTDLALLKVESSHPLTPVVFGNSDNLKPGEWVIAIGNPFKLGHTVTAGIVSAKSRKIEGGGPYDDFIQTDASINPGNSGGPLFNTKGEVVGVNTAIFSPGRMAGAGFNIGIGFATPVNVVKDVISQISDKGKVIRGWLGVKIQPIDEEVAKALELKVAEGSLVAEVMDQSPAGKAGILRRDVITKFDGFPVVENDSLPRLVAKTAIGKEVAIEINRSGTNKTIKVKIEELKDSENAEANDSDEPDESRMGLTVQDITPEIGRSLGLEETNGIVVTNVTPDSEADKKGIRRGDVIVEINSQQISSVADFKKLTKDLKKDKPLLILINRNNDTFFIPLKVE